MALTKADMTEQLYDELGFNKREAKELVEMFFEEVRAALEAGKNVKDKTDWNFKIYSTASAMYAAANVEKISACTELAKIPRPIIGNGINNGTNSVITLIVSSSAKVLPNSRKLNDKGFVKSSRILIGRRIGVG